MFIMYIMDLFVVNIENEKTSETVVYGIYNSNSDATTSVIEYTKLNDTSKNSIYTNLLLNRIVLSIKNEYNIVFNKLLINDSYLYIINIEYIDKTIVYGVYIDEFTAINSINEITIEI